MIPRNRSVKIVVILKNMTPRIKDNVMPAGGKPLRAIHQFELRVVPKNPESDEISLRCYIKRRILIRMACGHQKMHGKFEKIEALQLQHELEGKSYTEVEIFAEVLGTKAGYVRGLGRSVRFVGSSSSAASVDLSRRLEEARLEIEEMRAR
ncbi:hypothetical protein CJ030_MR2G011933 [Morella rubra]|uniref:Uncharacterized protein n=1 Tax=Morella rubra TaxID=262757 RepID=A0A6A1WFN5_9ROSI|nr:hypothetical protein CJ030_MR2G011933 [Morella rubra]